MIENINKKVTLISGYFYPEDTAIGLYNTQLVDFLIKKGYEVNVITGFPSYPQWEIREDYKNRDNFLSENYKNAEVYRYKQYVPSNPTFLKRIALTLDFTYGSFINIRKIKKTDVIICVVPHTSTLLLGWLLKKRTKAKMWNHIQDFEFDAAKQTGISSSNNVLKNAIFGVLFKMESKLLNTANISSTISQSMLEKLKSKSKKETFYFPNWIDEDDINPNNSNTHKYLKANAFKILYSGNIGDKQDWESFLKFVGKLNSKEVQVIIVGDGSKKNWLVNEIKVYNNVHYFPPVDYSELSSLLCSADLHVLFQKQDVIDSVMPSKLLGMMASAKPSLIVGNPKSEVKKIVKESEGGYYIANNDLDKCISIVENLITNPDQSEQLGLNARKYITTKFSREMVLASFEAKLIEIMNK